MNINEELIIKYILNHFINQSLRSAIFHCNVTELCSEYDGTIAEFVVYLYKNKDSVGYNQKAVGKRSITYEGSGSAEYIKSALPFPKIKEGAYDV